MYRTHEDAEKDRVQQAASPACLNGSPPDSSKDDSALEGHAELEPLQSSQQELGKDSHGGGKPRDLRGFQKENHSRNIKYNYYCRVSLVLGKLCN